MGHGWVWGGGVGIYPGLSDSRACSQTAAVPSADGGGTTGIAFLSKQNERKCSCFYQGASWTEEAGVEKRARMWRPENAPECCLCTVGFCSFAKAFLFSTFFSILSSSGYLLSAIGLAAASVLTTSKFIFPCCSVLLTCPLQFEASPASHT